MSWPIFGLVPSHTDMVWNRSGNNPTHNEATRRSNWQHLRLSYLCPCGVLPIPPQLWSFMIGHVAPTHVQLIDFRISCRPDAALTSRSPPPPPPVRSSPPAPSRAPTRITTAMPCERRERLWNLSWDCARAACVGNIASAQFRPTRVSAPHAAAELSMLWPAKVAVSFGFGTQSSHNMFIRMLIFGMRADVPSALDAFGCLAWYFLMLGLPTLWPCSPPYHFSRRGSPMWWWTFSQASEFLGRCGASRRGDLPGVQVDFSRGAIYAFGSELKLRY